MSPPSAVRDPQSPEPPAIRDPQPAEPLAIRDPPSQSRSRSGCRSTSGARRDDPGGAGDRAGAAMAQVMIIPIVLGVLVSYALGRSSRLVRRRRASIAAGVVPWRWRRGGLDARRRSQASAIVEQLLAAKRLRRRWSTIATAATAIQQVRRPRPSWRSGQRGGGAPAAVRRAARAGRGSALQHRRYDGDAGSSLRRGRCAVLFLVYFLLPRRSGYRRKLVVVRPSLADKSSPCRSGRDRSIRTVPAGGGVHERSGAGDVAGVPRSASSRRWASSRAFN
jgi:hypothetical protein